MSQAIKLTIPDSLAKISQKNAKVHGYNNLQDLALDGLRRINMELNSQKILERFYQKQDISLLTKEERKKIFDKHADDSKIFREFDLE
jgi:hypothetical protein